MNRIKEIYLTVFTFPRYTLWKRKRKDAFGFSMGILFYASVVTIYLYLAWGYTLKSQQFVPLWTYILLWSIANSYFGRRKGDKP